MSTHSGPICPYAAGMSTCRAMSNDLRAAGFKSPILGKVAISSFMGEWGYLLCTKSDVFIAPWNVNDKTDSSKQNPKIIDLDKWNEMLPLGVKVLDKSALQSFYIIPKYYYR